MRRIKIRTAAWLLPIATNVAGTVIFALKAFQGSGPIKNAWSNEGHAKVAAHYTSQGTWLISAAFCLLVAGFFIFCLMQQIRNDRRIDRRRSRRFPPNDTPSAPLRSGYPPNPPKMRVSKQVIAGFCAMPPVPNGRFPVPASPRRLGPKS